MALNLFDLQDEIAVVVGGTGALGGAIASGLASCGARVVIVGRNAERGNARVAMIEAAGGQAQFCATDASDHVALRRVEQEIHNRFGTVTTLVNAAGGNQAAATIQADHSIAQLSLEAWQSVFELNVIAGALCPCQVFGEVMVRHGAGSVINVASLAGMVPLSRVVAYSAAKAAVINFTQFLARKWAPHGVRVNCLSPGFFPAQQNRELLYNADGSLSERGEQIIDHTPMARFGQPDELAGAAIWLASRRASSFVTGQNIVVDGGFSVVSI